MTDLIISPVLAERLQAIAEHEGRSLEETLTVLVDRYGTQDTPPGSTIPDDAIDVPSDITDAADASTPVSTGARVLAACRRY
ncbi:MAG: hypothetical protein ACYDBJ_23115 [Aggregatilineales bacterium]